MTGFVAARTCRSCGSTLARDNRGARCAACGSAAWERLDGPPDVAPEFWEWDQMRAALDARHMGHVVAAYRRHPFHGVPLPQEVVGHWVGLSQSQISRLESGPPVKDLDRLTLWARTLRIPPDLLWFTLPDEPPTRPGEVAVAAAGPAVRPARPAGVVLVPSREPGVIDRPGLCDTVISRVVAAASPATDVNVVAVSGPGGFGKTTLATQAARDGRIAGLFSDVLWAETGEHCTPNRIVRLISDLCMHLGGERSEFSDPEQAGFHLASVLADRRVLLVIDNVWSAADLDPFLLGGQNTVRLVTTRNARTCPSRRFHIRVGPMSSSEVSALLLTNLSDLAPERTVELAELCQGWPLLASVVGASVAQDIAAGADPGWAVTNAIDVLSAVGPPAFDIWDSDHRTYAIGHAITASLQSLTQHVEIIGASNLEDWYLSLAIFPPATAIPLPVLSRWWRHADGWTPNAVRQFCRLLVDRCLIDAYLADRDAILVHDVFRAHLRHLIGDRWPALHDSLLAAYREEAPRRWADLPTHHSYMWRHLTYHLREAGLTEELLDVVGAPDYLVRKATLFGHESLADDHAALTSQDQAEGVSWRTAHALTANAYLLHGLAGTEDIAATMLTVAARRRADPATVAHLRELVGEDGLRAVWATAEAAPIATHVGAITALAVHGRALVSGGEDGVIRRWDLYDQHEVHQHHGHMGWIYAVAISPDGRLIASAGDDLVIRLWDLDTGEPVGVLLGHTRRIRSLAFATPRMLVSGAEDGRVQLWATETGRPIRAMQGPGCAVWTVAPDARRSLVAAAGADPFVRLYDLDDGTLLDERAAHDDWVRSLALAGSTLVSGSGDGSVQTWDTSDRRLVPTWAVPTPSRVRSVALSSRPGLVVAAGEDATLRAIDADGIVAEERLPESVDWIRAVAAPDDGVVVAGCEDGSLRRWDLTVSTPIALGSDATWSSAVAGDHVVLGRSEGRVEVWDMTSSQRVRVLQAGRARVWSLAVRPGVIAAAGADGSVRVWPDDDRPLRFAPSERRTWAVTLSPDRRAVAASGSGGNVRLWELPSGMLLRQWHAHDGRIRSMQFDDSGDFLLTGGGEGLARLWRMTDGELVDEFGGGLGWIRSVAMDGSASHVAMGCGPGDIYVCDRSSGSGRIVAELRGHRGRVLMIGFGTSPLPARTLVSAAADGTVRLWSLADGRQLAAVRADASLHCAAFAPGGMVVASSLAGTVAYRVPTPATAGGA